VSKRRSEVKWLKALKPGRPIAPMPTLGSFVILVVMSACAPRVEDQVSVPAGNAPTQRPTGGIDSMRAELEVASLRWREPTDPHDQPPILSVDVGQDQRLTTCGSDAWPDSMLVLATAPVAYCVSGFDSGDPKSIFAAKLLAMELQGKSFNDAELEVLRLRTLMLYAPEGSAEGADLRRRYNAAWDDLTEAEQRNLSE
jgi:hypothetical protein